MDKFNEILINPTYKKLLSNLKELEKDRVFCNHNIEHFLDVSRIAYIINLEQDLGYSKDIIYGIGLLHDIGRVLEYTENIPHHDASVILANEILSETSFTEKEKEKILMGISNHRKESDNQLAKLIYQSDKLSRNCFVCNSQKECYWSEDKKNHIITY